MRRATLLTLAVAALLGGCAGDDDARDSARVKGDTLTVYASLPAHGESAAAGRAAELGVRRALADSGGRIAGKRIELVVLPSTRPGDTSWDPGTIEANAERAADDPTAIAYVGELDQGGSAVSLPVTNGAGVLQVSPADGLTSLTRRPPGRPKAGPERYYPEHPRNFVRLVPPDLEIAQRVVESLRERPARRLAVLHGDRIADRELESMILWMTRKGPPETVARVAVRDADPEDRTRQAMELVDELVTERPDAALYAGAATREAEPVLRTLAERMGAVPVLAGPQLATPAGFTRAPAKSCAFTAAKAPTSASQRANPLLHAVRSEGLGGYEAQALLAYDAAQLALDAIEDGGPDRRRVISAAHRPGSRGGLFGTYSIDRRGDAAGRSVECVDLAAGG